MKKTLTICLVALMTICAATLTSQSHSSSTISPLEAQQAKEKKSKKKEYKTTLFITDLNCESCSVKIMNTIPYEKGVKDVKLDVPSKTVSVRYNSAKTNDTILIQNFRKIDINAEVAEAAEVTK